MLEHPPRRILARRETHRRNRPKFLVAASIIHAYCMQELGASGTWMPSDGCSKQRTCTCNVRQQLQSLVCVTGPENSVERRKGRGGIIPGISAHYRRSNGTCLYCTCTHRGPERREASTTVSKMCGGIIAHETSLFFMKTLKGVLRATMKST